MTSEIYDEVRDAIVNKRQVVATYGGHRREMCPHAIGLGPAGNEQALFYQFAGGSSQGDVAKIDEEDRWRCMNLNDLRDVEIVDGDWHSADNHSFRSTCIKKVDLEVEY